MTGVLEGIRVIDFGQYIAGPLAGMMLADQGADVVRVDPPGGPRWATPANATWNRGKRSVVLDLKDADDLKIAQQLIGTADVVVENFRPGVMERLGLGAEAMTETNPRLIYCSMPGFAPDDPRAGVRAWEGIVAASTWTYRPSPSSLDPKQPIYTAIPIASSYAAFISAVSIAMSLITRERYGVGQRIMVPLFDAMFPAMGSRVITLHDQAPAALRGANATWTRTYECKDGRWIQYHSGNRRSPQFLEAAGTGSWDQQASVAQQQQRIEELFKSRSAQEWEELAASVGSEAAICRTTAEWMAHPHALESRMVIQVDDPKLGKIVQPGINARLSSTPGAVRGPAPQLNAHRAELLAEIASRESVPSDSAPDGVLPPVLDGVKVLDLCIVLAGPTCGRALAEFGADVIKIDSPDRERVSFHNEINRAKRSIVLNLKSEEGLSVFWRLLENADVVVQNFRKDVAERLGIGYEQVRQRKPDIIYASLNTYGQEGPWAFRPGHEQIAQAATGMQERFGGEGQPLTQPFAVNDYGTGFMGAYAVALALLHRQRTAEGQHVDTALAYTSCTLQSRFLQDYAGKRWDEARGQSALGTGPLSRAYQASDGWLFIAASNTDLTALTGIEGLAEINGLSGDELERFLEQRLMNAPVAHWVERLTTAGIGAHRVVTDAREVLEDQWVVEHGLSVTREHDDLGRITTTGPAPRLSRTPVNVGRPAPRPGSDAREILEEIGRGDLFDRLVEEGVVRMEGIVAG
jgi:crotonobetainyl-CoA:carnitine CoA-transferase CaiB-like acyl-CoA transferase